MAATTENPEEDRLIEMQHAIHDLKLRIEKLESEKKGKKNASTKG